MAWSTRYFKGKKIYALVDEQGELVVEEGLVPIRYQDSESAKVYRATARLVSRDAGGETAPAGAARTAAATATREAPASRPAPARPSAPSRPAGERIEGHVAPADIANYPAPPPGVVEIYTDGACSGNPGPCGYGAVLREGDRYFEVRQFLGIGTNNIAELTGIKVALEAVQERSRPVELHTDSTYCIGVLTQGWKAKANQELILEIKRLLMQFPKVRLLKVKGHAGHPLNERADYLATSAIDLAR